jgi:serine/threonine-protein kinase RsbW
MVRMRLPARLENLDRVRRFVLDKAQHLNFSDEVLLRIDLVVEELAANVILYAYPHEPGDMEVGCWLEGVSTLCIELQDQGLAFDPTSREEPDIELDCSKRGIGGLGLYLVRRMVDGVDYRRENGRNILSVRFTL